MANFYKAEGGTITLPLSTIKVTGGMTEKSSLGLKNTTGASDSGNVEWTEGNYRYGFSLRGEYIEGGSDQSSGSASDTMDKAERGSASIQVGNGETWSGTVVVQRLRSSPDWGRGGAIGVNLQGVFTGAVTVSQS